MTNLNRLTTALGRSYRVERELGAGGMATVYLAHDLRHERDVAIKVLHPDLGAALGADRFLAEIKTTAKLQHPHILPLLDSGAADGLLYYVMPYVRGETLRTRLERDTQLAIPDAVRLASEVADALDHAHKQGVIHRDIKPENILLQDGHALVADFGIALAVQQAGGQRMTQTGLSLGTPQYMSPEQATGEKVVDARSDLYALAAVTYEMLTGAPPFTGASVQAIMARVMTSDPEPPTRVRKTIPLAVEAAVLQGLAKLPADRQESAAEFRRALNDRSTTASMIEPPRVKQRGWGVPVAVITALVAVVGWLWSQRGDAPAATSVSKVVLWRTWAGTRWAIGSGRGLIATQFAMAPDGSRVVFGDSVGGALMLVSKARDEVDTQPIKGTENGTSPVFSPDGQWIAFVTTDGRLRKMPVAGGQVVTLAENARVDLLAVEWMDDGTLIYPNNRWGLSRVDQSGRALADVHAPKEADGAITMMHRIPGTSRLLMVACERNCTAGTRGYVFDVDADSGWVLKRDVTGMWYAPDGIVLYTLADGGLMASRFNPTSGKLIGEPKPALPGVSSGQLAASDRGDVLYAREAESAQPRMPLVWLDRQGRPTPVDTSWRADFRYPTLSPDGRTIAVAVAERGVSLWLRGVDGARRKINGPGRVSWRGEFTADGRAIDFISFGGDSASYDTTGFQADLTTGSAPKAVASSTSGIGEMITSPDGQWRVFRDLSGGGRGLGMRARRTTGDTASMSVQAGAGGVASAPTFSPDGKWIAWIALERSRYDVYIAQFPSLTGRRAVSPEGGTSPRFSRNGRELFFVSRDSMMAVPFTGDVAAPVGAPRALFPVGPYQQATNHQFFDVTPDGQRFIMVQNPPTVGPPEAILIGNWWPRLKAIMDGR